MLNHYYYAFTCEGDLIYQGINENAARLLKNKNMDFNTSGAIIFNSNTQVQRLIEVQQDLLVRLVSERRDWEQNEKIAKDEWTKRYNILTNPNIDEREKIRAKGTVAGCEEADADAVYWGEQILINFCQQRAAKETKLVIDGPNNGLAKLNNNCVLSILGHGNKQLAELTSNSSKTNPISISIIDLAALLKNSHLTREFMHFRLTACAGAEYRAIERAEVCAKSSMHFVEVMDNPNSISRTSMAGQLLLALRETFGSAVVKAYPGESIMLPRVDGVMAVRINGEYYQRGRVALTFR
ncbi:hypothetical protein [Thalassomonas sp. RHCl1]|uniref:hypothetical protein n=1 Tax=Thalassomonas sp. RHCl1 TaxID=2995320 RepID=UPI00248B781D|nr:hypothetical protein [Thalassomonas sp. RHCl1]